MKILALLGVLVIAQGADSDECKKAVEQVVVHCAPAASVQKQDKVGNLAENQRQWFQSWYQKLGFQITIPRPAVSDSEFARRQELNQFLVYRPASQAVSYEAFLSAVSQGDHWTVINQAERAKIVWELTPIGYWFWAEVASDCPRRLQTNWTSLNQAVRLLSLEEYVIVWYAYKFKTSWVIDRITWSWLRTRFGAGTLFAYGYDGQVDVYGFGAVYLSVPYGFVGGRVVEVVKNAT